MADKTGIEWTDASWNPLVGCSKVSRGCKHCYAMTMAARIANAAQRALRDGKQLTDVQSAYRSVVKWRDGGERAMSLDDVALPRWNNEVALIDSILLLPLRWTRPRMVFVNSMSDLFHPSVPFEFVDKVFAIMALTPQHTYQILTKRPERMAEYFRTLGERITSEAVLLELFLNTLPAGQFVSVAEYRRLMKPLPNVWLGTSVEDQATADARIPHLIQCPAAVRFLSCEPLVGPVDLTPPNRRGGNVNTDEWLQELDWIIAGGESGHEADPMHPDWVKALANRCQTRTDMGRPWPLPFFFKQWGEWFPGDHAAEVHDSPHHGWVRRAPDQTYTTGDGLSKSPRALEAEGFAFMVKIGKKKAGRTLYGRTWNEFPEVIRG